MTCSTSWLTPAFLRIAWERVAGNTWACSAGIDGLTVRAIEANDRWHDLLADLRRAVRSGMFGRIAGQVPDVGDPRRLLTGGSKRAWCLCWTPLLGTRKPAHRRQCSHRQPGRPAEEPVRARRLCRGRGQLGDPPARALRLPSLRPSSWSRADGPAHRVDQRRGTPRRSPNSSLSAKT